MGQKDSPTDYNAPGSPLPEQKLIALGRVLQTLREEENTDLLIETTLEYLRSEFDYRLAWIGLYDRLDHRLIGKGGFLPTPDDRYLKQRFILTPGDLLEQVVIQQRPVGIPNLQDEVRAGDWRKVAQQVGVQGTQLFPLLCKDRCFGVVLLGSHLWGVSPKASEKTQLSLLFGGLATALYQIELDWQRSATKRPDQPLFQMLEQVATLPILQQRLEAIVSLTQQFIAPTRTSIYWFESNLRYFWHRVGNHQSSKGLSSVRSSSAGLTVQEVTEFYHALTEGRLIAIGAGRSPLKAEVTGKLLSRLKARSLLAAPILVQEELVGFLAVEGSEARIWEEVERNFIKAAAQVISLAAGREEVESQLHQTQQDAQLLAEIVSGLVGNNEDRKALEMCGELVLKRLDAERFLILEEENTSKGKQYKVIYQRQPLNRRPLPDYLPSLSPEDWQAVVKAGKTLMIEDWEADKHLSSWQAKFGPLGIRSLLISRAVHTQLPGRCPLIIVAHSTARTWSQSELAWLSVVSQQIGLILHSLSLHAVIGVQTDSLQYFQTGLSTLAAQATHLPELDSSWLRFLSEILDCPLAALLIWEEANPANRRPSLPSAILTASTTHNPRFALAPELRVPVTDELLQEVMASDSPPGMLRDRLLLKQIESLSLTTRQWLNSSGIGQVVIAALPNYALTPEMRSPFPCHGFILLACGPEHTLPIHLFPVVETLLKHFAFLRQVSQSFAVEYRDRKELEELHWYKHRSLENLHLSTSLSLSRWQDLETQSSQNKLDQSLARMHSSQILHQLRNNLSSITPLIQEEQWTMLHQPRPVALASILKRVLYSIQPLYNQRQLSVRSSGIQNTLTVYADPLKLECILFELLLLTGRAAPISSRIDLWCRSLENSSRQPSSTNTANGTDPDLEDSEEDQDNTLADRGGSGSSILGQSRTQIQGQTSLQRPSGTSPLVELLIAEGNQPMNYQGVFSPNLPAIKICKSLIRSWGGNLKFYLLESGRYMIRLLLPQ